MRRVLSEARLLSAADRVRRVEDEVQIDPGDESCHVDTISPSVTLASSSSGTL